MRRDRHQWNEKLLLQTLKLHISGGFINSGSNQNEWYESNLCYYIMFSLILLMFLPSLCLLCSLCFYLTVSYGARNQSVHAVSLALCSIIKAGDFYVLFSGVWVICDMSLDGATAAPIHAHTAVWLWSLPSFWIFPQSLSDCEVIQQKIQKMLGCCGK